MADGEVAVEWRQVALVEDLRDEAHVFDDGDGLPVAHRDPGRLLTPVLERVAGRGSVICATACPGV